MPWIDERWGNRTNRTALLYTNYFWRWKQYFEDIEITHPATLRREHVTGYLEWRKKRGGERNTAIHEIKFLGTLMDEAINRGYATTNPARKLHIKKTAPAEKVPWSEFEVEQVGTALDERDKFNWMHVTFLMGLYQADAIVSCVTMILDTKLSLFNDSLVFLCASSNLGEVEF